MIWIKNHGVTGESDNLRLALGKEVEEITCHKKDADGCPAIVKMWGWTGVKIDLDPNEVKDGFETALDTQIRFAVDEDSNHDNYSNKNGELDAYYAYDHPDV